MVYSSWSYTQHRQKVEYVPTRVYIWGAWLYKATQCRECEAVIPAGTKVVRGSFWAQEQSFPVRAVWHTQCWVKQLEAYLDEHPYQPRQGRKPLQLNPDARRRRRTLCVQWSRLRIERLRVIDLDLRWKLPELDKQGQAIMAEMATIGGVPKSWAVELAAARGG